MPFKNAEDRKRYMTEYLKEFREGKRRRKPESSDRVCRVRATRDKLRKLEWEMEHREERVKARRAQRRMARIDAVRGLLRDVAKDAGSPRKVSARKPNPSRKAA